MLTNEQKSLLKRAQRQAGISDDDYRDALNLIAGVQSSTDPRIGDRHLDKLMGYFEAIYWKGVADGVLDCPEKLVKMGMTRQWLPFLAPDYWKNKNSKQETSRDRYVQGGLAGQIADLEREMGKLGFNAHYCNAIRVKVTGGSANGDNLWKYKAALERTLASKQKKLVEQPF